jgi:hypothetical protein
MAIGTSAAIEFYGTQDTVTVGTGTSAVSSGAFSAAGDVVSGGWTNDDDAPMASVVFEGTFASAPTANTVATLYARLMNISSTNDAQTPDANNPHYYLGSFPLNDSASAQYIAIDVALPNSYTSQVYDFYITHNAGQSLNAGWKLYVTPKTLGPHA